MRPLDDMRLPVDQAVRILQLLLEGMSIRSVERSPASSRHDSPFARAGGERCQRLMSEKIRNIEVRDVEVDEIWGFVGKKEGHKWDHERNKRQSATASATLRWNTVPNWCSYYIGKRSAETTDRFISRLALVTKPNRYQLTSDGSARIGRQSNRSFVVAYIRPVGQGLRLFPGRRTTVSHAEVVDAVPSKVMGNPDSGRICTSISRARI